MMNITNPEIENVLIRWKKRTGVKSFMVEEEWYDNSYKIIVYTSQPGIMIGCCGKDIFQAEQEITDIDKRFEGFKIHECRLIDRDEEVDIDKYYEAILHSMDFDY